MIKLSVEDYCHDCAEFEPVKYVERRFQTVAGTDKIRTVPYTVVKCVHRMKCLGIRNYLKKEAEK